MAHVVPEDDGKAERAELLSGENPAEDISGDSPTCEVTPDCLKTLLLDSLLSIPFWWFMFTPIPDSWSWYIFGALVLLMVLWRVYRARTLPEIAGADVPYTTGYVSMNGKELYLVATIHISPRAPVDVETVVNIVKPDVVMIELDEERLDRMRPLEEGNNQPKEPKPEDLQLVKVAQSGGEPSTVFAQRAFWNAERAGEKIAGSIRYDADNEYGLLPAKSDLQGAFALVKRGGPEGEFAPFALKAHRAYQAGALAVLIMDTKDEFLPMQPFGRASLTNELKVAMKTCSCGFPAIPALLLAKKDGDQIYDAVAREGGATRAEFDVRNDNYPRRTLRRRLCQGCALIFSGIGILYGIIQCFAVEVGGEFIAAERVAKARGLPCVCIDSDLNSFWSRLGSHVVPTPCNIAESLLAWIACPRVLFRVLFPSRNSVDVVGGMCLHAISFSCWTWLAFILAGAGASWVTNHILELFSYGAEAAAEKSGTVKVKSTEDRDLLANYIAMAVEFYMLPRIYQAVAACRDEVMYRSIVVKSRRHSCSRMAVVVGAGHANGILQRCRTRGL